ncbi:hypothetical protein BpHYR1_049007 [Brachionus plicatilis]|uniref:Uncharacterized protein n=1 Tax=Brachionus plicatilis TaxID=10195 RepID=A0A3M7T6J8_BRAPC|nr:hypothetical protein BpHYR1_049007 [Brachionus plicatilis]
MFGSEKSQHRNKQLDINRNFPDKKCSMNNYFVLIELPILINNYLIWVRHIDSFHLSAKLRVDANKFISHVIYFQLSISSINLITL